MREVFAAYRPDVVMHLAAESHVDRSIDGPAEFIHTNIVGTHILLETALRYWQGLPDEREPIFAFITSRPTRCSARWARRPLSRDHGLRAAIALFGLQGGVRPSGASWHHTYGLPSW